MLHLELDLILRLSCNLSDSMVLCFVLGKCLGFISGNISILYGIIQQLAINWIVVINLSHIHTVTESN